MQYKVAVIGAGSIGANKPDRIDYPGGPNILTHCNAIDRHQSCELMAIVDPDSKQLMKAKEKWNPLFAVNSYSDLVLGHGVPDIVVVAVPTEYHYDVLIEILDNPAHPKLVIGEKPFCRNLIEANAINSLYKKAGIPIAVDYIRRYATKYQEIKKQFDDGIFGRAQNARVLYGRGWKRESSHAIDLMNYFFGKHLYKKILPSKSIYDYSENDPTISTFLKFEKCDSVVFQNCDGRNYGIFEIDICFEKERIRFIDNGLYIERYQICNENEWGHKSLSYNLTEIIRQETGLNTALYNLIDNVVKFLNGGKTLLCTDLNAVKVHEVLAK